MIDEPSFSIDDEHGEASPLAPASDAGPAASPPPLVVIQYRNRGLFSRLLPPILILAAAVAITLNQRRKPLHLATLRPAPPVVKAENSANAALPNADAAVTPTVHVVPRLAATGTEGTPPPTPAAPLATPSASVEPAAGPNPAGAVPDPSLTTVPEAIPVAPAGTVEVVAENPSPFEFDPDDGLKPVAGSTAEAPLQQPTAAAPVGAQALAQREPFGDSGPQGVENGPPGTLASEPAADGGTDAPVTREQVLQDIQREAAETRAERKNLEELKPRARGMLVMETVARVHSNRVPFRNELKDVLVSFGASAGPEIERLCDQYGREMIPETKMVYQRALRSAPVRMTRTEEINFMRACGLPEPVILDFLAHKLHKTMNTRGGPKNSNEVRIRAAQQLLAVALPKYRAPAAPPEPARGDANTPYADSTLPPNR